MNIINYNKTINVVVEIPSGSNLKYEINNDGKNNIR
jgi:inorganic pyrophosphatase